MTIPYGSLAVTVNIGAVIATAAHALGEAVDDLIGPSRRQPVVTHRAIAMAAAREMGFSFPAIGRAFGGRDQNTAFTACQRVMRTPDLAERARIIAGCSRETEMFSTDTKPPGIPQQRPPINPQVGRRTI